MRLLTSLLRTPESRVWAVSALMAAVAAAIAAPTFLAEQAQAIPTATWWCLLPAFALSEVVVIHLPAQRSSHSHVLREIPAIAGLTFLAPEQYVTAYVLGAGVALLVWSHQRGLKLAFNVSMFMLEAVLGSLTYHLVLAGGDPIAPRAWAAAVAAVLVTDLISAAAVTSAISFTESRFDAQVLHEALRSGIAAAMVNTCVALLMVTLVVARPSALPLLGAAVVLLVLGYRVFMSLARGHAQTELLYRFVRSTGHASELDEVVTTVLSEAAVLLHATRARLVTVPQPGVPARSSTWEAGLTASEDINEPGLLAERDWWQPALTGESVLLTHPSGARARHTQPTGAPRDGLAVPLLNGGEIEAVLMVADRAFEEETFDGEDLRVFETLAAHAAVALDNARAIARLTRLVDERQREALHDPLTGLLNRRGFGEAVEVAMGRQESHAVLLLDLDDFKDVNDTLGHTAGDRLLTVTGQRLLGSGAGQVARLGGDEFAVLLHGMDVGQAVEHARELHRLLSEPVPLREVKLTASASIGVTGFRGSTCSSEEILAQADVAMYAAKAARTGVQAYRPEDGYSTARRLALAADLPVALREHALELWYQPQARASTGHVTGFEALLRWRHPEFGMVPPPEVVAVAQRTGLIRELTDSIIEQALAARVTWCAAGHDLDVAVNVTPLDVADPALVTHVDAALRASGTPPGALVLEITESDAMRDPDQCVEILGALAARGVRLSIDDFGTGYSSLAYLDRLPVHEVKIDQSFVFRVEKEAADSTIVRSTVTLAHDLGLRVVAEGVENDLAKTLITEMGCDIFQGYGLARPMPAGDVLSWLVRHQTYSRELRLNLT
jgi:diguanylate cyclase (GGDEF)-like protein